MSKTDLVRVDNTAEECLAGVTAHATVMEVGHGDVSTHRAVYHGLVGRGRGHRRVVVGLLALGHLTLGGLEGHHLLYPRTRN